MAIPELMRPYGCSDLVNGWLMAATERLRDSTAGATRLPCFDDEIAQAQARFARTPARRNRDRRERAIKKITVARTPRRTPGPAGAPRSPPLRQSSCGGARAGYIQAAFVI